MFRWYVVNTYSGHENKVKHNLEHRIVSLGQQRAVRNVVVPTEAVAEMKDNQKVTVEKRTMPGYVLVNMELNEDSWGVVKGTPGVTVKVVSGPLSDFSGEISEINEDAARLKVLVSIFGRETPVEVGFDQVKKL
jgi:transcriptional antiterminator NusG